MSRLHCCCTFRCFLIFAFLFVPPLVCIEQYPPIRQLRQAIITDDVPFLHQVIETFFKMHFPARFTLQGSDFGVEFFPDEEIDMSPLLLAAHYDSAKVADYLLKAGSNPWTVSNFFSGRNALLHAASRGNIQVFTELANDNLLGMDLLRSNDLETGRNLFHLIAISQTVKGNFLDKVMQLFEEDIAKQKLKFSLLDSVDQSGKTPLHLAVANGNKLMALNLLIHGANCQLLDSKGQTPLQEAAEAKYSGMMRALLNSKKCDPDYPDACGNSFYKYQIPKWAKEKALKVANQLTIQLRLVPIRQAVCQKNYFYETLKLENELQQLHLQVDGLKNRPCDDVEDVLSPGSGSETSEDERRDNGMDTFDNLIPVIGGSGDVGAHFEYELFTGNQNILNESEIELSRDTTPSYVEFANVATEMINSSSLLSSIVDVHDYDYYSQGDEDNNINNNGSSSSTTTTTTTTTNNTQISTWSNCSNSSVVDGLKEQLHLLKIHLRNVTGTIDRERMEWRSERDFMMVQGKRHLNSVTLVEKAIRLNKIYKAATLHNKWLHEKITRVDLHDMVQISKPLLPGQKIPYPPATKFVFTVHGKNLTASDGGRICNYFDGAVLANIRSKYESEILELSDQALSGGVWVGLMKGPKLDGNSLWWSDGTSLLPPKPLPIRRKSETRFHRQVRKAVNISTKNCSKLINTLDPHLEVEDCETPLSAALCETQFSKSWFSILTPRHQRDRLEKLNWTVALEGCSANNHLIDGDKFKFQNDDMHLSSLLRPLRSLLATPKLPNFVTDALSTLANWKYGEPCWIGLRLEKQPGKREADVLRWIDGSIASLAPGNNDLDMWMKHHLGHFNHHDHNHPSSTGDSFEPSYCMAMQAIDSSSDPGSNLVPKYSLIPCSQNLQCALCQTFLPF